MSILFHEKSRKTFKVFFVIISVLVAISMVFMGVGPVIVQALFS